MEMQVRTILRSHCTLGEMEKINETISNKCWMTCEGKRDLHSLLVGLPLGKSVWKIFKNREVNLLCEAQHSTLQRLAQANLFLLYP